MTATLSLVLAALLVVASLAMMMWSALSEPWDDEVPPADRDRPTPAAEE